MQPLSWFLPTESESSDDRSAASNPGQAPSTPREGGTMEARGGIEPPIKVLQTFALTSWRPRLCCTSQTATGSPKGLSCSLRSAARSEPTGRLVALARGPSASIGDVQVHDGRSYQVAPLGPGTVVVADFFVTEQILQDKPGVGAALADTAVGDGFVGPTHALALIHG